MGRSYAQAAAPDGQAEVRIVVLCPDCPSSVRPSFLIPVVRLSGDIASLPTGQTRTVIRNGDEPIYIQLRDTPGTISMVIPNADEKNSPNGQIGYQHKVDHIDLTLRSGERWLITVTLRPEVWNNLRAVFGRVARYVVMDIVSQRIANT
jgi:hypothetical protein